MEVDHYFAATPGGSARRRPIEFQVAGRAYRLQTAGGVFSGDRLDPGTAVLLRKAPLPAAGEPGPLLDLGCGYGPIACVLASVAPAATVWAVDVNPRAVELTAANAGALGIGDRVRAVAPDGVPGALRFAQIWSNPPVRVGKAELDALLARWLPRLTVDGTAWLVAARHLGGDSLQRRLIDSGWEVVRQASQKGYRLLRVTRRSRADAVG